MASKPTKEQKMLIKERAKMEGLLDKDLLDNLISCFKKEESHGLNLTSILKNNTALLEKIFFLNTKSLSFLRPKS